MRWSERARHLGFRLQDRLLGSPVWSQMQEIERIQWAPPADRLRWQRERLFSLLCHARDTTRFYHDLIPNRFSVVEAPDVLLDLPVVDKRVVKSQIDAFVSSSFRISELWRGCTNGSTGEPFAYYMNRRRCARVRAETLAFARWAGYEIGRQHAFVHLLFWHPKSQARRRIENQIVFEPEGLGDEEIDALLDRLSRSHAVTVIGYPSVLSEIARRAAEVGWRGGPPLRSAIAMGELLAPHVRSVIEQGLGCPVFERYSASEVGYIAHDCERHRLHLNVGSLWIETGPPAPPAKEEAARSIVITDLFNYGMPLVRYELADAVVLDDGTCSCGRTSPLLRSIHGRSAERITLPDGRMIEATGVGQMFPDLTQIRQFQLVQTGEDLYSIRIVPETTFRDEDGDTVRRRAHALLGDRARIDLEIVPDIARLPGGKLAYILSDVPSASAGRAGNRPPEGTSPDLDRR